MKLSFPIAPFRGRDQSLGRLKLFFELRFFLSYSTMEKSGTVQPIDLKLGKIVALVENSIVAKFQQNRRSHSVVTACTKLSTLNR